MKVKRSKHAKKRLITITLRPDETALLDKAVAIMGGKCPLEQSDRSRLYHMALCCFCRAIVRRGTKPPLATAVDIREETWKEKLERLGLSAAEIRYCELEGINPVDYALKK
jgi:hypothetical protein